MYKLMEDKQFYCTHRMPNIFRVVTIIYTVDTKRINIETQRVFLFKLILHSPKTWMLHKLS